MYTYMMI